MENNQAINGYECPKCGYEHAKRYRIIDKSKTTSIGVGFGPGGIGVGVGVSKRQDASQFEPPTNGNSGFFPWFFGAVSLFIILVTLASVFEHGTSYSYNYSSKPYDFFVLVAVIYWLFYFSVFKHNKIIYNHLLNEWKRKMFCNRCGHTFLLKKTEREKTLDKHIV